MPAVVNIAAYKFVALDRLKPLRDSLRPLCKQLTLKGTILLSPEGINLFVAGPRESTAQLLRELRGDPRLADLTVKESVSRYQPFRRMLVKIKKEIITFDVKGIDPVGKPAPKISPETLKQWLDAGRDVTLLDVRNDYEVRLGTFDGAQPIGIDHFRHFPAAVSQLPNSLKSETVVMFCTGGIRCEKAGPYMEREGFQDVVQLDGGILKYFEQCGGEHYNGECFVFDQRVALDNTLSETSTTQCFECQRPLTFQDQQSPQYVAGQSCPYCFQSEQETMEHSIAARHMAIERYTQPLPGSQPYVNRRPFNIPRRYDGRTLGEFLLGYYPRVTRQQWQEACDTGRIVRHDQPLSLTDTVRAGQRIEHLFPATVEPDVNADIRIVYEDAALVVVHKPAPIPMHPCGRYNRNTLIHILDEAYRPQKLRVAHRLDANTSGIVVLSRTKLIASRLQPQFERGNIQKRYLARVHGHPGEAEFACTAAIADTPTEAGARTIRADGLPAITNFRALKRFTDDTALIECRPTTGRTNQIRLHLAHLGYPIQGDATYGGGNEPNQPQTLKPH